MKNTKNKMISIITASSLAIGCVAAPVMANAQSTEDGSGTSSTSTTENSDDSNQQMSVKELVNSAKKKFADRNDTVKPKSFEKDSSAYTYFEGLYIISELSNFVADGKDKSGKAKEALVKIIEVFPMIGSSVTEPEGFANIDTDLGAIKDSLEIGEKPEKDFATGDVVDSMLDKVSEADNAEGASPTIPARGTGEFKSKLDDIVKQSSDSDDDTETTATETPTTSTPTPDDDGNDVPDRVVRPGYKIVVGSIESVPEEYRHCALDINDESAYLPSPIDDDDDTDQTGESTNKPDDSDSGSDSSEETTKETTTDTPDDSGEDTSDGNSGSDSSDSGSDSSDSDSNSGEGDSKDESQGEDSDSKPNARRMSLIIKKARPLADGDNPPSDVTDTPVEDPDTPDVSETEGSGDETKTDGDDTSTETTRDDAPDDSTTTPNPDGDDMGDDETRPKFIMNITCYLSESGTDNEDDGEDTVGDGIDDIDLPEFDIDEDNLNVPDTEKDGDNDNIDTGLDLDDIVVDAGHEDKPIVGSGHSDSNKPIPNAPNYSPSGHRVLSDLESGYWDGRNYRPSEELLSGGRSSRYIVGEQAKKNAAKKMYPKVDTGGSIDESILTSVKNYLVSL